MNDKPTILAIDTSTEACSAAILHAGNSLWRFEKTANTHTALLLPMISSLLVEASLSLSAIDIIAVTRGPGSFTGVRIGIGIAQGLSFGLNKPVYEISTLQAIACTAELLGRVSVAIDARMQEVYTAVYDCEKDSTQLVSGEVLCSPSQLLEQSLTEQDNSLTLLGSGWDLYQEGVILPKAWQHLPLQLPHAKAVAELAYFAWLKGDKGVMAHEVMPIYLRDNVAEKAKVKSSIPL
jgi:tRNA threonylcarbamoyladenosine biosynthesis protein TsaB